MKSELKCKCGATAVFNDNKGIYINTGGTPDKEGRRYRVEVWVDEWLDRHNVCLGKSDG